MFRLFSWRPSSHYHVGIMSAIVLVTVVGVSFEMTFPNFAQSAQIYTCASVASPVDVLIKPDHNRAMELKHSLDLQSVVIHKQGKNFSHLNVDNQQLLEKRKKDLIELMHTDPDAAARVAFSSAGKNIRAQLKSTKNCSGESIVIDGVVNVLHADFPDGISVNRYILVTDSGDSIALNLPKKFADRLSASGERVRVSGILLDTDFLVDPYNDANIAMAPKQKGGGGSGGGTVSTPPPTYATGTRPQKTLVVMVYFQGGSKSRLSQSKVNDVVFNQMNAYYYQTSYGVLSVPGNTIDSIQLPITATCSIYQTMQSVVSVLDPQVNFADYQNIIAVGPYSQCGWGGVSWIGKTALYTADGYLQVGQALVTDGMFDKRVVGHEFGHQIGANHAGFLSCGSKVFPTDTLYEGCTMSEYGDPYEIMGLGFGEMNAPHRESFGWFDPANVMKVIQSGTYVIEPLENKSTGLKVLRIPRTGYADYYVEYRQPLGDDKNYVANVYSGPILHFPGGMKPQLLDATPPSDTSSPALSPGKTIVDPLTGTVVTTVSANAAGATVTVTLGKSDFLTPSITNISPIFGTVVSGVVSLSLDATDASGVSRVEFLAFGTTTPFAVLTDAPYSMTWDSRNVPNGRHVIEVRAYDNAGSPYGVADNVAVNSIVMNVSN